MKSRCYQLTITLLLTLLVLGATAQEKDKKQEIGLTFSNLHRFGITYRIGKDNKRWRYNLIQSNVNETEFSDTDDIWQSESFTVEIGIGREIRKELGDNLQLRYGLDLTAGFTRNKSLNFGRFTSENDSESRSRRWEAMIMFIGGLNYQINDRILLGAEILPAFGVHRDTSEDLFDGVTSERKNSGYFFNLSNGGALLSLVYAF